MKRVYATIAAILISNTAFAADNLSAYNAPAVSDWSGAYAGLQYGRNNTDFGVPDTISPDGKRLKGNDDGDAYGIHVGYMQDLGKYVLGGELDYNRVESDQADVDLWRIRGRGGYDLGKWLPYVTLGGAFFSVDGGSDESFFYGIGVDFKATEQITVGAEYTRQSFNDFEGADINSFSRVDIDADLFQIRTAYHF